MRKKQRSAFVLTNISTKNFSQYLTAKTPNFSNFLSGVISPFKMIIASAVIILPMVAFSQTQSSTNPTDSYTPASLATGAPAGSYSISDIENINLFNGNLNITFPLMQIGGRGNAGYTMSLPIENKWRIQDAYYPSGMFTGPPPVEAWAHHYYPSATWWTQGTGFGPGIMQSRRNSTFQGMCPATQGSIYGGGQILTQMTFSGPGGTEMSFYDRRTGGTPAVYPVNSGCNTTPDAAYRGNVWVTGDGSNVTFITDYNLTEYPGSNGTGNGSPSGDMYFPNGTHYRIDVGKVSYINDRNGNKTSFTYGASGHVSSITDSLNRSLTNLDPTSSPQIITSPGIGGVARTIEIGRDSIQNVLQTGYTAKSVSELFPELGADVQNNTTPTNFTVFSYVKLPNGKQYNFKYNSYGDIARIELPTGGAIEYYWNGTATTGCGAKIRRWVTERRVYPNGGTGTGYESKTKYEYGGDTIDGVNVTKTTVTAYDGNNPLSVSKHYFTQEEPGCDYNSSFVSSQLPTGQFGREIQTESYSADGASLLRKVKTDFDFRSMTTASYGTKQVDYRPIRVTTTLADVSPNLVSKQEIGYDPSVDFTRQTDVYEYDFGNGQVGAFKRRSHTDYLTNNPVQANANYLDNSISLKNLPVQMWVSSDAAGNNKVSLIQTEYDSHLTDDNHAELMDRTNVVGFDSTNFGTSNTKRGNPTSVTSY